MLLFMTLAFAGTWGEVEPGTNKGWTLVELKNFKDPGDIELVLANHDWAKACLQDPAIWNAGFSATIEGLNTADVTVSIHADVVLNSSELSTTTNSVETCVHAELTSLSMSFGEWKAKPNHETTSKITLEYRLHADDHRPTGHMELKHGLELPDAKGTPVPADPTIDQY